MKVPSPIGGLNFRDAQNRLPPTDAKKLDNWIPDSGYCRIRESGLESVNLQNTLIPECAPYSCSAITEYFVDWQTLVWEDEPTEFPYASSDSGASLTCTNSGFGGNFNKIQAGAILGPDYCELESNWCFNSDYAPGVRPPGYITTGVLDENQITMAAVIGPASGSTRITGTLFNNQHALRYTSNGIGGYNTEARVQVVASGTDVGSGVFEDTEFQLIIYDALGPGSDLVEAIYIGDATETYLIVIECSISDPIIGSTSISYDIDAKVCVTGASLGTKSASYTGRHTPISGGVISNTFSVSVRPTWFFYASVLNIYGIHAAQDGVSYPCGESGVSFLRNFSTYTPPAYCND